ncbi:transcription initiation factor IIB [Haloarculaceae archaeon H-GB2-1]|nr:transcription initiation factor IIB [Haloarculaceae archaeon H-GB1-1]MEA5389589.1 transcription initiation factor IIB [Haloarculaceae archaeon H-GB11]MEA5409959.1 transcription initiation factor IIB [Haloarculaceae archaeon H-GB2-1]
MLESKQCPECEGAQLVTTGDEEVVCEECGLVVESDVIDRGPEWRAYTSQERDSLSRVGAPQTKLMHDKGLTTEIDWRNKDANDRALGPKQREKTRRLRTWQKRIRTRGSNEQNLRFALSEIQRMASSLDVPRSVRESAATLYRQALVEDLLRGRSIESVSSACLYGACREADIPRSLEEMSEIARVERIDIGRAYRAVAAALDLEFEPIDPRRFVPRFASQLDLSEDVRTDAHSIIEDCTSRGLHSGKSPTGVAAAALYNASIRCGEKRTQQEIADVAHVTTVTIRKRYQEQREVIEEG